MEKSDNNSLLIEEYRSLRQEMLERFERIHDTVKWVSGGFIAFLYFYWTQGVISPIACIIILELFIALLGLSVLRLYRSIYFTGSYLGVILESRTDLKWHTMSGFYSEYLTEYKTIKNKKFPFGDEWGGDSQQVSFLLIALNIIAIIFFILVSTLNFNEVLYNESIKSPALILISFLFASIAVSVIFFNIYIWRELWDIGKYKKKNQDYWVSYRNENFSKIFDPVNYKLKPKK